MTARKSLTSVGSLSIRLVSSTHGNSMASSVRLNIKTDGRVVEFHVKREFGTRKEYGVTEFVLGRPTYVICLLFKLRSCLTYQSVRHSY